MSALSIAEALEKAADRVEAPGAWAQGYYGYNDRGSMVDTPEEAVCFCCIGAIEAAQGIEAFGGHKTDAEQFFSDFIGSITTWNDAPGRTQAEVVTKLREAAALARREGR